MATLSLRIPRHVGALLRLIVLFFTITASLLHFPEEARAELVEHTLLHDRIRRSYLLFEPERERSITKYPLILVLHGGGGTASGMANITRGSFEKIGQREGAYVVYPEGIGRSWNDGRSHAHSVAARENIDDLGFLLRLIQALATKYPIDLRRIVVTGISNGGFMAFSMGCRFPDLFLAIAPVTATLPIELLPECRKGGLPSLVLFNGTDDPIVPYEGGDVTVFGTKRGRVSSTRNTVRFWQERNRCAGGIDRRWLPEGKPKAATILREQRDGCDKNSIVVLYSMLGGGHTWPGGRQFLPKRIIGDVNRDIDAAEEIWKIVSTLDPASGPSGKPRFD